MQQNFIFIFHAFNIFCLVLYIRVCANYIVNMSRNNRLSSNKRLVLFESIYCDRYTIIITLVSDIIIMKRMKKYCDLSKCETRLQCFKDNKNLRQIKL